VVSNRPNVLKGARALTNSKRARARAVAGRICR